MPSIYTRIRFLVILFINLFSIKSCFGFSTSINNQSIKHTSSTSTSTSTEEWREYCPNCNRPTPSQCLCEHLPTSKIRLQTHVVILQHPVEFRRKTISTVPLIKLCLERVDVLVGRSFDDNVELQHLMDDVDRVPLLLFPGDDAVTLDDDNISDVHQQLANHCKEDTLVSNNNSMQSNINSIQPNNKYLLIIVDGTWKQAKQILRNSPSILQKCQSVQFKSTSQTSIYDSIRKQPDSHCLSTLESCERTLQLLEPNDNENMKLASHYLLSALKAMILTQMKYEQIYLESHPELVRNVDKLHAKKIRQEQIKLMDDSMPNDTHDDDIDTVSASSKLSVQLLPKGYKLRQLKSQTNDAQYVDSIWPYSSKKSLGMIEKQMHADNVNTTRYTNDNDDDSTSACCLGIEYEDKELVACIIRHRNGSLGILHVEPQHRHLGLAQVLLKSAMISISSRDEKLFAYIVDGNKASERLFSKLGWRKDDPLGKRGTG